MRNPLRILFASLLLVAPVSCKRTGDATDGPGAGVTRKRAPAAMPKPYKVDANPPAAAHIRNPAQTLQIASAYVPGMAGPLGLLRQGSVAASMPYEARLVGYVDPDRPWNAGIVQGQLVVQLPVKREHAQTVASQIASLPAEGKFGARKIPAAQGGTPRLVYFDDRHDLLTFADDLRGLATGYELQKAYGKQPLFVTATAEQARKYGVQVPFSRFELRGDGAHDFKATVTGVSEVPGLQQLRPGALTGLLETPQLAAGVSSRYANYEQDVASLLRQAKRQVDGQNFLIRGTLEDLYRRGASVLRSWNGRTMLGTGPSGHALLGLGTDDPVRAEKAVLHLISGVRSNLSTARSFGVGGLPSFRYKKDSSSSAGASIHMLVLERAKKFVPPEYAQLVDGKGELRVALAFPRRAGAAMVVIGADAESQMQRWLEETAKATPAGDSRDHFAAATFAVGPQQVESLLQNPQASTALRLDPGTEPLRLVLTRKGDRFDLVVRGDEDALTKIAQATRAHARETAATRTPPKRRRPAAGPTAPARRGKRVTR